MVPRTTLNSKKSSKVTERKKKMKVPTTKQEEASASISGPHVAMKRWW